MDLLPRLDTGGLRVGDPVPAPDNPPLWLDDEGQAMLDALPDYLPVCDAEAGCETIVGFADAVDLYPELAEPGDPRISELGYQPEAMELVNENGNVTGYLPPDEAFMTRAEFEAVQASDREPPGG